MVDGSTGDLTRLARGGVLNLVGGAVNGIASFVLIVVATRGLRVSTAGAFFTALAIFTIAGTAVQMGADVGLVRMIARDRTVGRGDAVRRTLAVALIPVCIAGCIAGAAIVIWASALASAFGTGSDPMVMTDYLRVLGAFVPIFAVYSAAVAATRGFGTMMPSVAIDKIATPMLQPLLIAIALAAGLGAGAVSFAYGVPFAVGLVAVSLWLRRLLEGTGSGSEPDATASRGRGSFGAFWRFTAPRGLATMFQVAVFWLDTLLLGAFVSTRAAGIYTASTRYVLMGSFVLIAVINVIAPQLSELLTRGAIGRARTVYQTATGWIVLLTWPAFLTLAIFAPLFLRVFGRGFEAGASALAILSLSMLVSMACGPVDVVLLMAGKSTWNLANTVVALSLNVGRNLLLIPRYGMVGAAVAWAVSVAANNVLPLLEVWILLRLEPFGSAFAVAACASAVLYGGLGLLARWIGGASMGAFAGFAVIATGLYAAIAWRFRSTLELPVLVGSLRRRSADQMPLPSA